MITQMRLEDDDATDELMSHERVKRTGGLAVVKPVE